MSEHPRTSMYLLAVLVHGAAACAGQTPPAKAPAAKPAPSPETSGESSIEVSRLNPYLLFFFDGRDAASASAGDNWVADAAMKLGVGTYAIHRGDEAIVYDTFPSVAQARWVRAYLEDMGIRRFTVVLSHWHLDHIAGNAVYQDSEIIASARTSEILHARQGEIAAGQVWGPPAIDPVVLPTSTFEDRRTLRVGDLEVALLQVNIHSKDSTMLYLPRDRIALVGDTLEDPLTYMVEVGELANHLAGLEQMKEMDIERIYPNHGDPAVIAAGGYDKTLIDATMDYIGKMLARVHDPGYLDSAMEDYIGDSLARGWVHAFEPYRQVHQMNLKLVHEHYEDKQ